MHLARPGWIALLVSALCACGAEHSQGTATGGAVGTDAQGGSGGTTVPAGGTQIRAGGTAPIGGGSSEPGGSPAQGGSATGGQATGGSLAGGAPSGGAPDTGGTSAASGGRATSGGTGPGGTTAGGNPSGGRARGGSEAGGAPTGGAGPSGGNQAGGTGSGGRGTGGASTGGNAAGGRTTVIAEPGSTLVKIDPGVRYQTFEGWGTSLCWWAHRIGAWPADKRNEFLDWVTNPATGLGYNVFRYNIGGGENPAHSHMTEGRDMPGFEPSEGVWDWQADARQTAVLSRLAETAENVILEAFSNSPPYWMTKSGCASGSSDGSDNLKDDSYDLFADYLTEVVKHYRDELGITFRTLEPMNEPNANWWKADGGQEGCHFGAASQQKIIKAVGAKLQEKGLDDTRVSASDENSMDDALGIMSGYDSTTLGYMAQMNVHSYAGSRRSELRALATSKGKRLWQSESGPLSVTLDTNTDAAMFMAERIITDLRQLEPEAWIDWQTVDTSMPWTSFSVNDAQQTWSPQKRFYMHAGFSRFIRPGATFVDIDHDDMVAAVAADGSVLTVVVRNGDKSAAASYTFDLTALASVGSSIEVYRTSASENLDHLPSIQVNSWSFTASSAPYSVTTYVVALSG
ncbi:MAG: alpha-L-arabinofuranosidase [Polyangiaceae bacterium]|nr:alpha-L-arabinofuranosidase [Polyangiaceae bacterium]